MIKCKIRYTTLQQQQLKVRPTERNDYYAYPMGLISYFQEGFHSESITRKYELCLLIYDSFNFYYIILGFCSENAYRTERI